MQASKPNALFVYGTLAPGEENAHIMDGINGCWLKATVRGRRYATGYGALKIHPGFFPDETAAPVSGLVFVSDDLPKHWSRLDAFEGPAYERVIITARLEDGCTMPAFIYAAKADT